MGCGVSLATPPDLLSRFLAYLACRTSFAETALLGQQDFSDASGDCDRYHEHDGGGAATRFFMTRSLSLSILVRSLRAVFRLTQTFPEPEMRSRELVQCFPIAMARTTRGLEVQQPQPLLRTEERPPLPQQQGARLRLSTVRSSAGV